jgi:hypothetical protein
LFSVFQVQPPIALVLGLVVIYQVTFIELNHKATNIFTTSLLVGLGFGMNKIVQLGGKEGFIYSQFRHLHFNFRPVYWKMVEN